MNRLHYISLFLASKWKRKNKNIPPGRYLNARNARFDVLSILMINVFSCVLFCFLAWILGKSSSFPWGLAKNAHLASAACRILGTGHMSRMVSFGGV